MSFMSVSQYAKHAGLSRQALYNWEAKQGFPHEWTARLTNWPVMLIWPGIVVAATRVQRMQRASPYRPRG